MAERNAPPGTEWFAGVVVAAQWKSWISRLDAFAAEGVSFAH